MTINIQGHLTPSQTTPAKNQNQYKENTTPIQSKHISTAISSPTDLLSRIKNLDIKESVINKTRTEGSFKSCADWGNSSGFSKATL